MYLLKQSEYSVAAAALIKGFDTARKKALETRLPSDWQERVRLLFGSYFWFPFSDPHTELWEWANAITSASAPQPFGAFWPRGRGKSTTAEAVVVDLGARGARTYCMYVSGTQDQADKHVQTIARMMESQEVASRAPGIGEPRVSKNGNRAWNRSIVTTASGFTVEAVGLNKAVRGQKVDWARPDLIVFDDVDEVHDTDKTVEKKEKVITGSILPAGSTNAAVLFVQNLIHSGSIALKLATPPSEGGATYLMDRHISGPYPAVEDLEYEDQQDGDVVRWVITKGRSLWKGFDLTVCEREINKVGPRAYEVESQHEVDLDDPDALLKPEDFKRTRVSKAPTLNRVVVSVDPPSTTGQCGIVAVGKAKKDDQWHGYTLEDASTEPGARPHEWALAALQCYVRHNADAIVAEINHGGLMVEETIRAAIWKDKDGNVIISGDSVPIELVRASRGKIIRAEPVATLFLMGRGHHVGEFPPLEKQWGKYRPGDPDSPDRLDAEVWGYRALGLVATTGLDTWSEECITEEAEYSADLPIEWCLVDGYEQGYGRGTDSYKPRIVLAVQFDPSGVVKVVNEYCETEASYSDTFGKVEAWGHPSTYMAYVDKSDRVLRDELTRRGIQSLGVKVPTDEGDANIRRIASGKRLQIHPRCTNLIYEMGTYSWDQPSTEANAHSIGALRRYLWHKRREVA